MVQVRMYVSSKPNSQALVPHKRAVKTKFRFNRTLPNFAKCQFSNLYSSLSSKCTMQDLKHKILLVLTAVAIIGEVASIILWTANPILPSGQEIRFSLAVDYTIAVANAAVFAVLNLIALVWIIRKNKIGPLFLIAISIINRVISHPIFIGGAHGIFITWTAILVIFAYLDYRKLSKQK